MGKQSVGSTTGIARRLIEVVPWMLHQFRFSSRKIARACGLVAAAVNQQLRCEVLAGSAWPWPVNLDAEDPHNRSHARQPERLTPPAAGASGIRAQHHWQQAIETVAGTGLNRAPYRFATVQSDRNISTDRCNIQQPHVPGAAGRTRRRERGDGYVPPWQVGG